MSDYKNFWVYVELTDGKPKGVSLELLAPAKKLAESAGEKLVAVIIGKQAKDAANQAITFGADEVIVVEDAAYDVYSTDGYAHVMEKLVEKYKPAAILVGASNNGRDIAPRIACRLNTGLMADITAFELDPKGYIVGTRSSFNGSWAATVAIPDARPQMATVRAGVFKKLPADEARTGNIIEEKIEIAADAIRTKVVEVIESKAGETVDLETADIIVTGGRGLGNAENFSIVKELAEVLGATVGASRAAVDADWISHNHQVGQTGKKVQPSLYVACGVSGAIQHLAGMSESKIVVAINTDEDAPIFKVADFGVVGDLRQIVPAFTKVAKEIKEKNK